jgi:hypothetical protein
LAEEAENAPDGASKVAEYKQVISEQKFLAYAWKILQSLYDPNSGESNSCGPNCPHARRRATLNRIDVFGMQNVVQQRQHQQDSNYYGVQQQMHDHNQFMPQDHQPYMPGPGYVNYDHVPLSSEYDRGAHFDSYAESLPPGGIEDSMEPLPYRMPYHQTQDMHQPMTCPVIPKPQTSAQSSNWEPLDYAQKTDDINYDSISSFDTEALRRMLTEDVDMESDAVSRQLSEMIRRKSHGLIRIDAVEAFEDLVFEEDSTGRDKFEFPEPQVANAPDRHISGLTDRGESLMEMSLLTIEDKDGAPVLKAIDERSVASLDKRPSKVSFALNKTNISVMSMDIGSLSDLAYDHNASESYTGGKTHSAGGSPRRAALNKYAAGLPTEIPDKTDEPRPRDRISTLTLSDASALQSDLEFNELAGNISPPRSDVSVNQMSFSNMSLMSVLEEGADRNDEKRGLSGL